MAPGPPLSDAGLPARRGGQTAAVAGGTPAGQDAAALLPLVGARAERRSAVHLQRHVEALPPGRRQEGWAGDPHSRPVPHHEPPEQGDRRGPGPGSAGLEGPGPGADPHAYPLALAQAPRAPHGPARGAPGGAPPAQPQGGPRLSLEGRLPVLLAVRLAPLGGVVPGPVVHPHAALPARAHAEGRPHAPRPPPAPPQLVSGQRGAVQRRRRGLQQQGAGHHPPGLRIPHLSRHRSRPLPYAWGSPRTGHYPQILLRRLISLDPFVPARVMMLEISTPAVSMACTASASACGRLSSTTWIRVDGSPAPIARTKSRRTSVSVTSPIRRPSSVTGRAPIFSWTMSHAASSMGANRLIVMTVRVMTSATRRRSRR